MISPQSEAPKFKPPKRCHPEVDILLSGWIKDEYVLVAQSLLSESCHVPLFFTECRNKNQKQKKVNELKTENNNKNKIINRQSWSIGQYNNSLRLTNLTQLWTTRPWSVFGEGLWAQFTLLLCNSQWEEWYQNTPIMALNATLTKYHPWTKNGKHCQEAGWNIKIDNRQGCK